MPSKKNLNFEANIAELEQLLARLSNQEISLEESVKIYAQAAEKINACTEALQSAKLKIESIDMKLGQNGEL